MFTMHTAWLRATLFVPLLLLFAGCGSESTVRTIRQGVVDLSAWDFTSQGDVALRGEWEFAFGELLQGRDFDTRLHTRFVTVPSDWNDITVDGRRLPAHGCASYRLRILTGQARANLAIDAPKFIAYSLFVNGTRVGGSGRVGCSAAKSQAEYQVTVHDHLPVSDTLDIVVWISNFQYWKGGFWKPLLIGNSDSIRRRENKALLLDTITITALMGFAISMLIFYFSRPSDRVPLFLVLLCLIGVIRTVSTGQLLILSIIPGISWDWVVSLELVGFYAMGIGWLIITHQLFPQEFPLRPTLVVLALPILLTTASIFLPVRVHAWAVPYMKLYWIALIGFALFYYVRIVRNRREGAILFFGAFLFTAVGTATEMLYIANVIPLYFPSVLTATVDVLAFIVIIARRSARALQRVERFSVELEQRVEERTSELRTAQEQLVQREKLAALGQLTAGIAHEIRNPLNFVNNFASLSRELLEELPPDVATRGDVAPLVEDLRGNLTRISQHGARVDGIIRGMMLHARESTSERRLVDVHALLDEAINLAYHSARARIPGFEMTVVRHFDPAVPPVEAMPQEISRVLINLLSNAIDAIHARKLSTREGYIPEIRISTSRNDELVELRIRDNGVGVPPEIRDRLFLPFVTSKPAGSGTGLGLSISHDIVVKGHAGTLTLEPDDGLFTEFRLCLPFKNPVRDAV